MTQAPTAVASPPLSSCGGGGSEIQSVGERKLTTRLSLSSGSMDGDLGFWNSLDFSSSIRGGRRGEAEKSDRGFLDSRAKLSVGDAHVTRACKLRSWCIAHFYLDVISIVHLIRTKKKR